MDRAVNQDPFERIDQSGDKAFVGKQGLKILQPDKVMDDLARARAEYEAITADADRVLIALDDAAQVLQNEYKFRTLTFINKPDEQVADPEYWKRHAIRYNNFGGYAGSMAERLIIYADPDTMTGRSEKALTAWKAAGRALNN